MGKKVCCLCWKTDDSGRWSDTTLQKGEKVEHVLCPDCFADTRDKVRKIYGQGRHHQAPAVVLNVAVH